MKKIYLSLFVALGSALISKAQVSDSLNPFTDQEILKLSNIIYELEKKDSLARATEPNGFDLKNRSNISDLSLLKDLTNDSIHYYTGAEVIKLSNYIHELERRDSLRKLKVEMLVVEEEKRVAETTVVTIDSTKLKKEEKTPSIQFHTNSHYLTTEAYQALDLAVEMLKKSNSKIALEGYADNAGPVKFNEWLSVKRAQNVKNYLVRKGIDSTRFVKLKGHGGKRYLAPNDLSLIHI